MNYTLQYIVTAESTLHSQTFLLLRCDLDIETEIIFKNPGISGTN